MNDEVKKPRRPRARAKKRISIPVDEPIQKVLGSEPLHPVLWVQCFGCGEETPQVIGPNGRARLPDGWVTLFPTNRTSRSDSPDVYASEDCARSAAVRVRVGSREEHVTILKSLDFISLNVTLDNGVKQEP